MAVEEQAKNPTQENAGALAEGQAKAPAERGEVDGWVDGILDQANTQERRKALLGLSKSILQPDIDRATKGRDQRIAELQGELKKRSWWESVPEEQRQLISDVAAVREDLISSYEADGVPRAILEEARTLKGIRLIGEQFKAGSGVKEKAAAAVNSDDDALLDRLDKRREQRKSQAGTQERVRVNGGPAATATDITSMSDEDFKKTWERAKRGGLG